MEKGDETLASPTAAAAAGKMTAPIGGSTGDDVTATADEHSAKSYAAVAAERTSPNGSVAEDEVTVTAAENPAKSYAAVVSEKTNPNVSVGEDEVTVTAAENPAKSYAAVAAEKTNSNGSVEEDEVTVTAAENPAKSYATVAAEKTNSNCSVEEGEVTVTAAENPAKSYATIAAEKTVPDGSVAGDEVTVTASVNPTKSYAAVAANAEIEDLRTTNRDLEEKLAAADREKKGRATEIDGLRDTSYKAKENSVVFEYGASSSDAKVLALREELKDLQKLLQAEQDEYKANKLNSDQLAGNLGSERQVKMRLEEEVNAMKEKARDKAAAAAAAEEGRVAALTPVPLQGARVAWPVMAGAAAVGAAGAAVALVIFLRLKR